MHRCIGLRCGLKREKERSQKVGAHIPHLPTVGQDETSGREEQAAVSKTAGTPDKHV